MVLDGWSIINPHGGKQTPSPQGNFLSQHLTGKEEQHQILHVFSKFMREYEFSKAVANFSKGSPMVLPYLETTHVRKRYTSVKCP